MELDEARLSEKQLKQKLDHQEEVLAHKSEELRLMSEQRMLNSMSSEVLALQIELTEMEGMKVIYISGVFSFLIRIVLRVLVVVLMNSLRTELVVYCNQKALCRVFMCINSFIK